MNNRERFWIWSVCLLFLAGCASVPMAPENEDAAAKAFLVPDGKANIYVVMPEIFRRANVIFPIYLDGQFRGNLDMMTFLLFTVFPGRYEIVSEGLENAQLLTVA